jgi:hypothetical protein
MLVGEMPKAGSPVEVASDPFESLEVLPIGKEEPLVDLADLPGDASTVNWTATV